MIVIALIILFIIFMAAIYKVADVNRALVITGLGYRKPKIKVSGGAFVIPILQKARYFPLDIMTITEQGDGVRTKTAVPVIIKWTAQVAIQTEDMDQLIKTVRLFTSKGVDGMINAVMQTIQGNVREIIAGMTPEEVLCDKKVFVQNVIMATQPDLQKLGLSISTLNMNEVSDENGYYDNMAAEDTQKKRQEAEIVKADTDRNIRERQASANQQATEKELAAKLIIAEKTRDNTVKIAEFKVETETAEANADMARAIQTQIRQVELNAKEGDANVKAKEKENEVAEKQNAVAETEARRAVITAKGLSEAEAAKLKIVADGDAEAVKLRANGDAQAVIIQAEADKSRINQVGLAEANIISAKGKAEGESIEAQGLAKANAEKALAEALAAHENVNFKIEQLKIDANARIEIATNVAKVMADLGANAKFVNIGGGGDPSVTGKSGNVLIDTLAQIPQLVMMGDVKSDAMNEGSTLAKDIATLIEALRGKAAQGDSAETEQAEAEEKPAGTEAVSTDEKDKPEYNL
jgi:flotillin